MFFISDSIAGMLEPRHTTLLVVPLLLVSSFLVFIFSNVTIIVE
jgi:hypothetical protein